MRELNRVEFNAVNGGVAALGVVGAVAGVTWAASQAYLLISGKAKWNEEEGVAYNVCFNTAGAATYPLHILYNQATDALRGLYDGAAWGFTGCKQITV